MRVTNSVIGWPCLSTTPTASHVLSACVHNCSPQIDADVVHGVCAVWSSATLDYAPLVRRGDKANMPLRKCEWNSVVVGRYCLYHLYSIDTTTVWVSTMK